MVIPLRSGRQNHPLGLGESGRRHGWDPPVLRRNPSRRHHRGPASASSRRGRIPDKQPPQDDDTTARFAPQCQSFLRPSSIPCLCAPDPELAGCGDGSLLLIMVRLPVRVLPAPPRTRSSPSAVRGPVLIPPCIRQRPRVYAGKTVGQLSREELVECMLPVIS